MQLHDPIQFIKGVGDKKAEILRTDVNIHTVEDLLSYYPYKYIDKSKFYTIAELNTELPYVQFKAKVKQFRTHGTGLKMRLSAMVCDETGCIEAVWFKGIQTIQKSIVPGVTYVFFGKPSVFNNQISVIHPEMELPQTDEIKGNANLEAAYNTTEKMKRHYITSKFILKLQQTVLKSLNGRMPETLPLSVISALKLLPLNDALVQIHFPESPELLRKAQYRLKFEELFYIQLKLLRTKFIRTHKSQGYVFEKVGDIFNTFFSKNLPFELTGAQKRVLKEIRKDTLSGKQMNRLLQGDVGSGKTLVALMCCLLAIDNGFQACIMAPTEILAQQHFATITGFLKDMPVAVDLLTGSTKTKARRELHTKLESGELQILIGTHALIEDKVKFKNLGFAVIDEQHRFGVAQRAKLWEKNELPPHVLVMTATPIPRTLAMTLYGDLDVSIIDELPPGRKPIKTIHAFDSQRLRIFGFMKEEIAKGRQIYVVYPLIQESENFDYKDLYEGYESITRAFPPPQYAVSVVHGQMKPEEKDIAMQYFVKGITHIMVATTVIEVGVNVPNASVMVIESAERFGLSQLHQLRGRVGRGADQSYCILMTDFKLSKEARIRLKTMVESNDGFVIAETDLKLRGPGDMEGTQQSGIPLDLKIADLARDGQIIETARNIASDILEQDTGLLLPEHAILVRELEKRSKTESNWRVIS